MKNSKHVKAGFLLFIICCTLLTRVNGQDYILTQKGQKIKCKITETDSTKVYLYMHNHGNEVFTSIEKSNIVKLYTKDSLNYPLSNKLELSFNPFAYQDIFSFNYFTFKFMLNDNAAFRLGMQLDRINNSNNDDDEAENGVYEEKSLTVGLYTGFEHYLRHTEKINTYWGMNFSFSKTISEAKYGDISLEGALRTVNPMYDFSNNKFLYNHKRNATAFGSCLFLGFDVYIYKNLYLGTEFGVKWRYDIFEEINYTEANPELSSSTFTGQPYKTISLALYANNLIRMGIMF